MPKRDSLLHGEADPRHGYGRRSKKTSQNTLEEIGIAITALIRQGFAPDYAMTLTPRQGFAYLEFAAKRDRVEMAKDLQISLYGSRGDPDAVEKTIKGLIG